MNLQEESSEGDQNTKSKAIEDLYVCRFGEVLLEDRKFLEGKYDYVYIFAEKKGKKRRERGKCMYIYIHTHSLSPSKPKFSPWKPSSHHHAHLM